MNGSAAIKAARCGEVYQEHRCRNGAKRAPAHAGLLATEIEESNYRLRYTTFDVVIVDEKHRLKRKSATTLASVCVWN